MKIYAVGGAVVRLGAPEKEVEPQGVRLDGQHLAHARARAEGPRLRLLGALLLGGQ